jgi:hypothetical protein
MPVILATWEAEAGEFKNLFKNLFKNKFKASLGKVSEILSQKIKQNKI